MPNYLVGTACFISVLHNCQHSFTFLSIEKMIMFDVFPLGHDSLLKLQDYTLLNVVSSQEQSSWVFVSLCGLLICVLSSVGLVCQIDSIPKVSH